VWLRWTNGVLASRWRSAELNPGLIGGFLVDGPHTKEQVMLIVGHHHPLPLPSMATPVPGSGSALVVS
jgi:hypothetical protein